MRDSEPGRPLVFNGGRVERVNLGNNLVGMGTGSHVAACLERSGGSGLGNNLDRAVAMSSNVGHCRESGNRGDGDRVDRASADRMAGLDRWPNSTTCIKAWINLSIFRVPSRLPSDIELRQRAAEEEEAVSSIVEEVAINL